MAADIANAFAALINQQLPGHTGQRVVVFPHVSVQQGVSGSYFGASLAAPLGREGLLTLPTPNMAMPICSTVSRPTAISKRRRPGSARKLAKLHSAMERDGRQLLD
ncbi:hypothetical protein H4R19_006632 [Coemansia spiralis]|nr:hypothetical protein H4R19_006632 [Coemansia spiralis]